MRINKSATIFLLLLFTFVTNQISYCQPVNNGKSIISKGIELHDQGEYRAAINKYLEVDRNDSAYFLMLSELTLTYLKLGAYDTVIYYCEKGLAQPVDYEVNFYMTMGTAYGEMGDTLKSIEIYNKAIEKFPHNHLLYFNQGATYYARKQYDSAVYHFQKAIMQNPFHPSSHLYLGYIMAFQKQFAHAFMSLETFLLLEPNSARSNDALLFLENLANAYLDTTYGDYIEPFTPNNLFERIDRLILSKAALTKSVKLPTVIDASFIKQSQLLFEMFPGNNEYDDFWYTFYGPFFQNVKKEDMYEPFYYNILTSTSNPKVLKWKKKNSKELENFFNTGYLISQNKNTQEVIRNGKKEKVSGRFFDSGQLLSLGNVENEKAEGYWEYFYKNGHLNACGTFIKDEKNGEWSYYKSNGILETKANYKEGKLHGSYIDYFENGNKKLEVQYLNGEPHGKVIFYYPCENVSEELTFVNGKKNGPGKAYYSNGIEKVNYHYKDNELDSTYTYFHENGSLYYRQSYKNGKLYGTYTEYYENGKLSSSGSYDNGDFHGLWKSYYANGPLKNSVNFEHGKKTGEQREFWKNGIVNVVYYYNDSGLLDGEIDFFNQDGIRTRTELYKEGTLVQLKSYNIDGDIIDVSELKNKTLEFKNYWPEKVCMMEGKLINDKKEGKWITYHFNGMKKEEYYYHDDELDGEYIVYYENETIKEKRNYVNGKLDGDYSAYYRNGQIKNKGYYQNGLISGYWINYFPDGSIKEKIYDVDGEINGYILTYSVTGKPLHESIYENGNLTERSYFDSLGSVIFHTNYEKDAHFYEIDGHGNIQNKNDFICSKFEGKTIWHYPNNKKSMELENYNSYRYGPIKRYYNSGKLKSEGMLYGNDYYGKWTSYHENGEMSEISYYYQDLLDSVYIEYYENGNIKSKGTYDMGNTHGIRKIYDYSGETVAYKYYSHDFITGYKYKMADGSFSDIKHLPNGTGMIKAFFENGKMSLEQNYQNGLFNGQSVYYYNNGNIYSVLNLENGEKHGKVKFYFPDGNIKIEKNYFYNTLNGEVIYYNNDGSIKRVETYKMDVPHGNFIYYKDGEIEKVEIYHDGLYYGVK